MTLKRLTAAIIPPILFVIAIPVILGAIYKVWLGTCALPRDLQFSPEFGPLIQKNLHDPSRAARLSFAEVSYQLAWHGKSRIHEFNLHEICQTDACSVEYVSIVVEVEHWPICSWVDNHFNHSLATITINDFVTLEAEFEIETIRVSWGSYEQISTGFFAELEQVQNRARRSVRFHKRPMRIAYNRYYGTWFPYDEWTVRTSAVE